MFKNIDFLTMVLLFTKGVFFFHSQAFLLFNPYFMEGIFHKILTCRVFVLISYCKKFLMVSIPSR